MLHNSNFGVGGSWKKVGGATSSFFFFFFLSEKKMPKQGYIGLEWIAS